jgi:RNA polymerase sigma-70 factor (ECF subfamily)
MSVLDAWADLDRYRAYLRIRARRLKLDPRMQARFDESDLVQEALLRAHTSETPCAGDSHRARMAYLDQAFDWALQDRIREHRADKRDVAKEKAVRAAIDESTAAYRLDPADDGASPSEQVARREEFLRAVEAVDRLPEDERDVVILTYLQGLTVQEAAERLGKTRGQVAGLYKRGTDRLRGTLNPPSGG